MGLKIKQEWINVGIKCPLRNIDIEVRLIEEELYPLLFSKGYSFLFETNFEKEKKVKEFRVPMDFKFSENKIEE
jgi:hypothetical protein